MADLNSVVAAWNAMSAEVQAIPALPAGNAPTIVGLSATPGTINAGQQSKLDATITNAVALTLDGVTIPGLPQFVAPAATHQYAVIATGASGTTPAAAQITVTVNVVAPPPGTGVLANLARNTARNLGTYVNPDPDWFQKGANITDDSGCAADPKRNQFLLFGGGHGRSQETDIRAFNTLTGQWSSLYPSTKWADMVASNLDSVKGRWINTNQPLARHTYSMLVVRGDKFHMLTAYCQPDNLPGGQLPYFTGKLCSFDFITKLWTYSQRTQLWAMYCGAILDPVSQMIYVLGLTGNVAPGRIWKFDPDADTIQTGPVVGVNTQPVEAVYCPDDDRVYTFERNGPVRRIFIDRNNINACTSTVLATTGPQPTEARPWGYPSFTWDSVNKRIGGSFKNGVHSEFNPVTSQWTATTVQVEVGSSGVPSNDFSCSAFMQDVGCYVGVQIAPTPRTWPYRP